jgi:hypothetical protein
MCTDARAPRDDTGSYTVSFRITGYTLCLPWAAHTTDNSPKQVGTSTRTIVRTCIGAQCPTAYPPTKANGRTASWTTPSSSTSRAVWTTDRTSSSSSTSRADWTTDRASTSPSTKRRHGSPGPTDTGPSRDVRT